MREHRAGEPPGDAERRPLAGAASNVGDHLARYDGPILTQAADTAGHCCGALGLVERDTAAALGMTCGPDRCARDLLAGWWSA